MRIVALTAKTTRRASAYPVRPYRKFPTVNKADPTAEMFREITHREVLERDLKVADATAFSLCMDINMPSIVFNLLTEGNIARAVSGERIGTLVSTPTAGVPA